MEWLSAANQEMGARNAQFEKLQQAKSAMMPQISAYAQSVPQMDPQSRELSVRQMIDEWNRQTGEEIQFVSVDGTNPFLATVIQNGHSQVI